MAYQYYRNSARWTRRNWRNARVRDDGVFALTLGSAIWGALLGAVLYFYAYEAGFARVLTGAWHGALFGGSAFLVGRFVHAIMQRGPVWVMALLVVPPLALWISAEWGFTAQEAFTAAVGFCLLGSLLAGPPIAAARAWRRKKNPPPKRASIMRERLRAAGTGELGKARARQGKKNPFAVPSVNELATNICYRALSEICFNPARDQVEFFDMLRTDIPAAAIRRFGAEQLKEILVRSGFEEPPWMDNRDEAYDAVLRNAAERAWYFMAAEFGLNKKLTPENVWPLLDFCSKQNKEAAREERAYYAAKEQDRRFEERGKNLLARCWAAVFS